MSLHNYEYARLSSEQIERIQQLERQLYDETGQKVTLIAFTPEEANPVTDCRAGSAD
jgi:hypothetical protein